MKAAFSTKVSANDISSLTFYIMRGKTQVQIVNNK